MEDITARLAATGDYEFLTMDLAIRTTTGRIIGSGDRPDIIGVRCDEKLVVWEVQSSKQSRKVLNAKTRRMETDIGVHLSGEVEIIDSGVFHVH